jgi:FkbM family methyltransferase
MKTAISEQLFGYHFKYFINDCMASNSVGSNKEWEEHITRFTTVYNSTFPIKGIIDIGANFGYHSALFSKECKEVYAFEPQKQNFDLLAENIKNNHIKNVKIYNLACGDTHCDVHMPLYTDDRTLNMGDITPNIDCSGRFTTTKSILLDEMDFPLKIDLIKIDVQGWEKKVLLGAKQLLKNHKPVLIVEFEHFQLAKTNTTCKELFDFIRVHDYSIFYLEYEYPSDHVCVHKDHLEEFRSKFKDYIFPHTETNTTNYNVENDVREKISMKGP